MKKSLFLFCLFFITTLLAQSQPSFFSDSTVISLITCSPGKEVYARFGHTAIRVNDPQSDKDIVFNYGIFDFNTHNFYLKFVKGETDYKLAAYDFVYFLPEYIERNSTVWEQILNLTLDEKRKLIDLLLINYEPRNRIYRYNFIFDNCSNRARDKILEAINGAVEYKGKSTQFTFREWVGEYVGENTWLKFGIDMVFGMDADVPATRWESMFLPEELMREFQSAEILSLNGEGTRPLISQNIVLYSKKPEQLKKTFFLFTPFAIFTLVLLVGIVLLIWRHKGRKAIKIFDTVLYILAGLIGCVVFYLMFLSLHPVVKHNLNILWLNPLFLIIAITQWIKPLRNFTFYIQIFNVLCLLMVIIAFTLSYQYINIAFIPLILLLLLHSGFYLRTRIKRKYKHSKRSSGKLHSF